MEGQITKKQFQKTMVTMVVAELSGAVTAIIDGIITGRFLGPTALAACGIGTPYFSVASILTGILMVGCTAMCTRAIGKGEREETSAVFSLTVLLGAVLSILLAVAGTAFSGAVATLFGARGASASLHGVTSDYLRGVFIGAPGFVMFVILTPILQLDGDTALPKAASIVCTVVDVAGDLLNVFVFRGGMFGMGLASSASHYAALAVVLLHFLKKRSLFRFSLRHVRFGMAPELLRGGLPRALCMLCRGLLPILLNSLALRIAGDMGVTAFAAMNNSSFVVGALGWGIGGAVLIMCGIAVGEQDVRSMETVAKTAIRDILVGVIPLGVAVFAAAPLIAGLFIPAGGEAKDMATDALRCYAVTLPFLAFNVSSANHFNSIGRMKGAYLLNVCIEFACTAVIALVLHRAAGTLGLWLAFPIGQALLCAAVIVYAVIDRDRGCEGLASFLLLPPGFGVPDSDRIERSIRSMDEVIALSKDVGGFCAAHGIGSKEANRLSLCIEEMAGNVIEHGFSDGKPHSLDVRVLVKDGQLVLRMRDDCALFDLREKADHWAFDPEHPERNIGIRMVMHAAKDIAYTNTMNTNNLIVTI